MSGKGLEKHPKVCGEIQDVSCDDGAETIHLLIEQSFFLYQRATVDSSR